MSRVDSELESVLRCLQDILRKLLLSLVNINEFYTVVSRYTKYASSIKLGIFVCPIYGNNLIYTFDSVPLKSSDRSQSLP